MFQMYSPPTRMTHVREAQNYVFLPQLTALGFGSWVSLRSSLTSTFLILSAVFSRMAEGGKEEMLCTRLDWGNNRKNRRDRYKSITGAMSQLLRLIIDAH